MGVEHEWRDAQREDGSPEVDQMGHPKRHCGVKQQQQVPHAHVDTRTSEPRVQNAEVDASGGKAATSSDVTSAAERQIAQDGLGVYLRGEHFEDGG